MSSYSPWREAGAFSNQTRPTILSNLNSPTYMFNYSFPAFMKYMAVFATGCVAENLHHHDYYGAFVMLTAMIVFATCSVAGKYLERKIEELDSKQTTQI